MVQVTLNDQQAKVIADATDAVEVLDHSGKALGYVMHAFSSDEISLAQQRYQSSQRRYTTQEALHRFETEERS
jgi:hypothetical protein